MIGVVAYWSVHPWILCDRSGPKRWMSLYSYTLRSFGVTDLIMIGTDIPDHVPYGVNYRTYPELGVFLNDNPDVKLVALTAQGTQSLKDYVHPVGDVLYVLGSDYGDVELKTLQARGNCDFVRIDVMETGILWAHIALGIVLNDRSTKMG